MLFATASKMKLWIKPKSSNTESGVTELEMDLHHLASADPSDGVKGDVQLFVLHGTIAQWLIFLVDPLAPPAGRGTSKPC
jgi:hypothetical protein